MTATWRCRTFGHRWECILWRWVFRCQRCGLMRDDMPRSFHA